MAQAIDVLMREHRVIERVLGALEGFGHEIEAGRKLARDPVRQFAEFFRNYADACHHGKEEDLLFERMVEFGFPRHEGPLAVMLYEHGVGRAHVSALRAIGEASGAAAETEQSELVRHAREYPSMLRSHIQKEDQILYPMAIEMLPPAELDRLAAEYDDFQRRVIGAGAYEEMQRLAERLVAEHPADALRSLTHPR